MEDKSIQKTSSNSLQNVQSSLGLWDARSTALSKTHYVAHATRKNPAALVIMIDQSGSMQNIMGSGKSKAQETADIVNAILHDTLTKCIKEEGLREYFQIFIFGYGDMINPIWTGKLSGKTWVTVKDLQDNVLEVETEEYTKKTAFRTQVLTREKYNWFKPRCDGRSTAMKTAFEHCIKILDDWTCDHEDSFPPLVFNITDGEPTDIGGNLDVWLESCERLKSIATKDGNTLLFNILLTEGDEIILPSESDEASFGSNRYHNIMYKASSILPYQLKEKAIDIFRKSIDDPHQLRTENPKCVIFNATASSLLFLITVGTITVHSNAKE